MLELGDKVKYRNTILTKYLNICCRDENWYQHSNGDIMTERVKASIRTGCSEKMHHLTVMESYNQGKTTLAIL